MSVPGNHVATLSVPLRWGDMDAFGHANNTVYFRFFEEARIVWLSSLNLGGPEEPTGPVIIKTSATFLKELNHPATSWWKHTQTRQEIPALILTMC